MKIVMSKKYLVLIGLFLFLSGCICQKEKKLEIEKFPEVQYIEEISPKISEEQEISEKEVIKETEKEEVFQPSKVMEQEQEIEKEKKVALLPKSEIAKVKKEEFFPEIYLKKWNGECLIYNMKWNLVNFGKAIVISLEEKENFHLAGITIPEELPARIGYGYNRVDTFVDKKTGKPKYFYLYTKTGRKEKTTEIFFNWTAKQYTCIERKYENKKLYSTKRKVIKFDGDIFDPLSLFYFLRDSNFENIQNKEFLVALTEKWYVKINFKGIKTQKLPDGQNKEVFVIEPVARSEKEKFKDGKLDILITKDEKKVVFFEGKVPLGMAKLILNQVQKIDLEKDNNINEIIKNLVSNIK